MRKLKYKEAKPDMKVFAKTLKGEFIPHKIKYIKCDRDYWRKATGYLKLGDVVIMHGDSRLNGSSTSKYSGYSAKNTMMTIQSKMLMGHVHRLAHVYHTSPTGRIWGIEEGCLCQLTANANWQHGYATFELKNGKGVNPQIHEL